MFSKRCLQSPQTKAFHELETTSMPFPSVNEAYTIKANIINQFTEPHIGQSSLNHNQNLLRQSPTKFSNIHVDVDFSHHLVVVVVTVWHAPHFHCYMWKYSDTIRFRNDVPCSSQVHRTNQITCLHLFNKCRHSHGIHLNSPPFIADSNIFVPICVCKEQIYLLLSNTWFQCLTGWSLVKSAF